MSYSPGPHGVVSVVNSTSTPLGVSATFTGTSEEVFNYSTVTVMIDSDVSGTLYMDLSVDGTNWDRSKSVKVEPAVTGSGSVHTLEIVSKYFRVRYVNNGTGQAHLRLQTIYHTARSGFLTSSPDQVISKTSDAQISRVANDPLLDIDRGLYADKSSIHKFGYNPTVPNGSFADIWSYGPTDPTYNWPVTAETFRVKSGGNVADTSGGVGARSIQLAFLDANGDLQQEQLTLAGSSASGATSVTGSRIIRAWVDASGAFGASNTGDILLENTSSGQIVGHIEAGMGQTQMSQYTIPKDFTGYLRRIRTDISVGTNKDADIRMWQRQNALDWTAPYGAPRIVRNWTAVQGEDNIELVSSIRFPELTDLWFEAKGNGAVTACDVDYDLVLVRDEAPTTPQ